jgi:polysaccharide deacetylase family protein (PEP-CTERM system associated)
MSRPAHLLTVDVEDWPQSTLNHSLPIGNRVLANTRRLLDILAEAGVRGTFFVLGKVADRHPKLSQEIVAAGHEVATHGYSHESVEDMPIQRFKEELHRSVDLLRQQIGQPILGHRAADFSISERSLFILECLAEEGLEYDSSIFPIQHPRYGIPGACRRPHLVRMPANSLLVEFPLPTIGFGPLALPVAGGGYFRCFPYWWTKLALGMIGAQGSTAACYLHPYELDTLELKETPYRIPTNLRWSQFTNRRSVHSKLTRLLRDFSFFTMGEACKQMRGTLEVALDLKHRPIGYRAATHSVG